MFKQALRLPRLTTSLRPYESEILAFFWEVFSLYRLKWQIERKKSDVGEAGDQCKVKEDLKTVVLDTSKISYMEPSITAA